MLVIPVNFPIGSTKYLTPNLKEERVILSHSFRDFSSWSAGSKADIMVERYGREKLINSGHLGSRKRGRAQKDRNQRPDLVPKAIPP